MKHYYPKYEFQLGELTVADTEPKKEVVLCHGSLAL